MPYREQQFANSEIYHVTLRAIDDNLIFKDIDDYYRGIFSIYEFNTARLVKIRERRKVRAQMKKALKETITVPTGVNDERDKIVEVLTFSLMPNHIHLLLKQLKDEGISNFMQKIGGGYGGYFNRKYNRKGHVFQNRFVSVHIEDDNQLKVVFVYIHANPISLIEPKWKEIGIQNPEKVIKFLENYKWSSYPDYIGKKNFPSVTEREFLSKVMNGPQGCKKFVENWIRYKGEIREFAELALEEAEEKEKHRSGR